MAKLTGEAKKIIAEVGAGLIATSSMNGKSHVSAKGSLRALDDSRVVLVDFDSPRSMANLRDNPQLSALVFDADSGRSCRLWGKTEILEKGEVFDSVLAELGRKKMRPLVLVVVGEVEVY